MRRFLVVASAVTVMLVGSSSAFAQLGSTGGTANRSGANAFGSSAGLTQTGQVLGASDFGGQGSGNMLRAATVGGMMGMNNQNMMGMNAMGMGMGMNRMGGMGGMGGMGMGGMGGQSNTPALKIPIKLGFSVRTPYAQATPVRATRFEKRLTKLSRVKTGADLQVEVRAGIATLRGSVPTDQDREIVEQLALLEPGIDKVENELQVVPEDDT